MCALTIYSFVFANPQRLPQLSFLQIHGLSSGYGSLCLDKEKVMQSQSIQKVSIQTGYSLETPGSDAANENGKGNVRSQITQNQ